MPRRPREAPGGIIYHAHSRSVANAAIFRKSADYRIFEQTLAQTIERLGTRVLAYCLMPTHFHLVLRPREDGELSEFMHLLLVTHTRRWHAQHHTVGAGPLYQGRFRSFPLQANEYFLKTARYVESNPVRSARVALAQDWRWCSLRQRRAIAAGEEALRLSHWPVPEPPHWLRTLNTPQRQAELADLRCCVQRGRPFGDERWTRRITRELTLESTFRPRGRPRKHGA